MSSIFFKDSLLSGSGSDGQIVQVNKLPDPTEKLLGTIYQFTGEDILVGDFKYINGFFYKCKEISSDTGEISYGWISIPVQSALDSDGKTLVTKDELDNHIKDTAHTNKEQLDKIGENNDGTFMYNGSIYIKNETDKSLISKTDLEQIGTNKTNLETLMGDAKTTGSVAKQIADAIGSKDKLSKEIVDEIPDAASANEDVIYLVPSGENNIYLQYMLINGNMVPIGSTEINLENYATKDDIKDYITMEQVKEYVPSDMATISDLETKLDSNQGAKNAGNFLVVGEDGKVISKELISVSSSILLENREW